MAKKSMRAREDKRQKQVTQYATKRAKLKSIIHDAKSTEDDIWQAQMAVQKLQRDASPVRQQRRCRLTGRPHAVYRKFGLSRTQLREAMMQGNVPGLKKASW